MQLQVTIRKLEGFEDDVHCMAKENLDIFE